MPTTPSTLTQLIPTGGDVENVTFWVVLVLFVAILLGAAYAVIDRLIEPLFEPEPAHENESLRSKRAVL